MWLSFFVNLHLFTPFFAFIFGGEKRVFRKQAVSDFGKVLFNKNSRKLHIYLQK